MCIVLKYAASPDQLDELRARVGDSYDLICITRETPEAESEAAGAAARILLGHIGAKDIERARDLRWVQSLSAGVTSLLETIASRDQGKPRVVLTNGRGLYGEPIADHVLSLILAFNRGLPAVYRGQSTRTWRLPVPSEGRTELAGQTCVLIGTGDIGSAVARRAKALHMQTLGVNRAGKASAHTANPDDFDAWLPVDRLGDALERADHAVFSLPGTVHTRGLLTRDLLARLRPTAYLYNVGRGSLLADEMDLAEALRHNRLAGAGLDVFADEPPADTHPFWTLPNLILSPHCAGNSPHNPARQWALITDNLTRYLNDQPLLNRVDPHWQY